MTEVVRDVIKGVENYKQDVYEKFDKEIEEISKLREDVSNQIVPYSEQVKRLALSGPGSEAPKMVADMNKEFTQDELTFIQNQQLPLTANVFLQTLNEPDYAEIPHKVGKISLDLGQKKVHLSTTKTANKEKATKLQKILPRTRVIMGRVHRIQRKRGGQKKKRKWRLRMVVKLKAPKRATTTLTMTVKKQKVVAAVSLLFLRLVFNKLFKTVSRVWFYC